MKNEGSIQALTPDHPLIRQGGISTVKAIKSSPLNRIYLATDHRGQRSIIRQLPLCDEKKRLFATLCLYRLPGLVPILDVKHQAETLLVTEAFLEGKPLSNWGRGTLFSLEEMILSAVQMCRSLKILYENEGILHLDIKPENVLLNRLEQGTLIDFGAGIQQIHLKNMLCREQQGTRSFMSPERWLDPNLMGPQTDLYALSMTLAHWLSLMHEPHFPLWQWLLYQQRKYSNSRTLEISAYDEWVKGLIVFWPQ